MTTKKATPAKSVLPWVKWVYSTRIAIQNKVHHFEKSVPILVHDAVYGVKLAQKVVDTITGKTEVHSMDNILLNDVTHFFRLSLPGETNSDPANGNVINQNETLTNQTNGTQENNN